MDKSHIEMLQGMPIFGGIREDILHTILSFSPMVHVGKGDYFFRENDKGDDMFILETGRVAILKSWENHEYLLATLGPGDCFGEMEIIDLEPRTASVLAVEDCKAIKLSATGLCKVYQQDVKQFAMIHMNMGREVSRRLRKADQHLFEHRIDQYYRFNPDKPDLPPKKDSSPG